MKRLLVKLDPENKYRNALYWGNELVADGNHGLEFVSIESNGGKRISLRLGLSIDFGVLIVQDNCPEEYRYEAIHRARGDKIQIGSLNPACELIRISPNACDGCPRQPETYRRVSRNSTAN